MKILTDKVLLDFVANQQSSSVCDIEEFWEAAADRVETGVQVYGDPMPWSKTHDKFRFRPQELTIWNGVTGNGKSLVLGMVALWLMRETKVLIASMEMPPEATIARIFRQAWGGDNPSREDMRAITEKLKDRCWIYDQVDSVPKENIIAIIHYASQELGVKHFIIDSLLKCGIAHDDYDGQKVFIESLSYVAKRYDVHIHLVTHAKKSDKETDIPDKFSIAGSANIANLADNILIVSRNKKKEKAVKSGKPYDLGVPDCFIDVSKQRHGEWDGTWGFWWHEASQQWVSRQHQCMTWDRDIQNRNDQG